MKTREEEIRVSAATLVVRDGTGHTYRGIAVLVRVLDGHIARGIWREATGQNLMVKTKEVKYEECTVRLRYTHRAAEEILARRAQ